MTMTILFLAFKSLLVAAATLALLRLTRRRSSAERSTIAHLGLFALVALPFASLALPSLSLTMPESMARVAEVGTASLHRETAATQLPQRVEPAGTTAQPLAQAEKPSALLGAATAVARHAYLLPTGVLLLLTLVALLRLVGLRSRAEVLVEPVWLEALARSQRRMGFKNGTALLRSDELASPISWGLMRPTILLSDAAARSPEQAEAIIAHELAHVVQLDWAKLMLARVATAVFWFNPLAWVLAREAHQLREEAADDAVLAANIAGPDYADLLIGVARHECRGVLLGAHGVAPGKGSLRRRVARVLDATPARGPSGRSWVAGFAAGMLSMAAPLAALTFAPNQTAPAAAGSSRAATIAPSSAVAQSPKDRHSAATGRTAIAVQPLHEGQARTSPTEEREATAPRVLAAGESDRLDVDEIIRMRAVGVSPEYKRALAQAGLPGLTVDQLVQARSLDLTPDYVSDMRAAGMTVNLDQLLGARALGIDPKYIGAMRRLGVKGSLEDYQGMISLNVTPAYVRSLRARGLNITSPAKLTELKAVDFDPGRDSDEP